MTRSRTALVRWVIRRAVGAASLALFISVPWLIASTVSAQAPPASGSVNGLVIAGTGSTVELEGIPVQLVELGREPRLVAEARTAGGRFHLDVPGVSANATYVASAVVDGVTYLGNPPLLLSPELPEASVEIVVWPASRVRPELHSQLTGLTVVFVDASTGEVTLQREDLVENATPATWLGDESGVTLSVPSPSGARGAEGEAWYDGLPAVATFTRAGDRVAARVPLRPGVTLVTTRFKASADLSAAEFPLQLEAALPTDEVRILAPRRFARALLPGHDARAAEPVTIEGETVLVVESTGPLVAGASIGGSIEGIGGRIEENPLSDWKTAAIGLALVFAVVAGGAHLASRATAGRGRDAGAAPAGESGT